MARLLVGITLAFALACATTQEGAKRLEVVLSLIEITCKSCGAEVVDALQKEPGVQKATFDQDKAEVTVAYDPAATSPEALLEAARKTGNAVDLGAGKGSYAKAFEFPPEADVVVISKEGEDVDIRAHLVPGKVTVVDFFATWCGPCRDVDRALLAVLERRDDVAVRKLNVVDWDSAVAKRYLKDVPQLPYVMVFDREGKEVDAIFGLDIERLERAIEKGGSS